MISFGDSITLRLSSKAKEEFRSCEEGSYEDWCAERNANLRIRSASNRLHVVEILDRDPRKTRIQINDNEEAKTVFVAIASGTFGLRCYKTAVRLYDELAPFVPEKTKAVWTRGKVGL